MASANQSIKVALKKEYQDKVLGTVIRDHRITIKAIYERIAQRSPVYTGWYKNNHRIKIGGGTYRLHPKKRPSRKGALVDDHPGTMKGEFSKLRRLKAFAHVQIGNPTDFAANIESRRAVYQLGYVEGLAQAKAEIASRQKK